MCEAQNAVNPDGLTSILTKSQQKILVSKSDSSLDALAREVLYMKVCHVCKTECEESFELCPLCGAVLRDTEEEGFETEEKLLLNPVLLTSIEDVVSAEIFKDILIDNGIPYSSGNDDGEIAIQIKFGGTFVAEDIYVDSTDFEKAEELYKEFLESEENMEFDFENADFPDEFDGEI